MFVCAHASVVSAYFLLQAPRKRWADRSRDTGSHKNTPRRFKEPPVFHAKREARANPPAVQEKVVADTEEVSAGELGWDTSALPTLYPFRQMGTYPIPSPVTLPLPVHFPQVRTVPHIHFSLAVLHFRQCSHSGLCFCIASSHFFSSPAPSMHSVSPVLVFSVFSNVDSCL